MPSTDIAEFNGYGDLFGPDALARQLCEKVVGMSDEDMITKHKPKGIMEHGVTGQDKPRPGTKIDSSKVWQAPPHNSQHTNAANPPHQQAAATGGAKQPPPPGVPIMPRADLVYQQQRAERESIMPPPMPMMLNYHQPQPGGMAGVNRLQAEQQGLSAYGMEDGWYHHIQTYSAPPPQPQQAHHHAQHAGTAAPDHNQHAIWHATGDGPAPSARTVLPQPQNLPQGDMQQGAAQWLSQSNLFEHAAAQQQHGMLHQTAGNQQQGEILPAKLALINGSQLAAILDAENPTLLSHWGQIACGDVRGNNTGATNTRGAAMMAGGDPALCGGVPHQHRAENPQAAAPQVNSSQHGAAAGYGMMPPGLHDQQHHEGYTGEEFLDHRRPHTQQPRVNRNREADSRRCSCSFIFIGFDPVQHAEFELVPRLIGRGGAHMRDIAEVCRGKVRIRGRGSGYKEVRKGRRPPTEADVPLQIALSCEERTSLEQGKARLLAFLEHLSGHFQRYCRKQGLPVPPALYVLVGDE